MPKVPLRKCGSWQPTRSPEVAAGSQPIAYIANSGPALPGGMLRPREDLRNMGTTYSRETPTETASEVNRHGSDFITNPNHCLTPFPEEGKALTLPPHRNRRSGRATVADARAAQSDLLGEPAPEKANPHPQPGRCSV